MKSILSFLVLGLISASASADYLYESTYRQMIGQTLRTLSKMPYGGPETVAKAEQDVCKSDYNDMIQDGVLDIRVFFGYEDLVWGPYKHNGKNLGTYPSNDPAKFLIINEYVGKACQGQNLFCQFQRSPVEPNLWIRNVVIHGRPVEVRLRMQQSSVSEILQQNTVTYAVQQKLKSEQMDALFASALQEADVVIYNGHSRDGGGPDFSSPVFNRSGKVDYAGYYHVYRPGWKKMQSALSSAQHQPKVLASFSCDSRKHFTQDLRNVAPNTMFLSTTEIVNVHNSYQAIYGTVDSLMRGQCRNAFVKGVRSDLKDPESFFVDSRFLKVR